MSWSPHYTNTVVPGTITEPRFPVKVGDWVYGAANVGLDRGNPPQQFRVEEVDPLSYIVRLDMGSHSLIPVLVQGVQPTWAGNIQWPYPLPGCGLRNHYDQNQTWEQEPIEPFGHLGAVFAVGVAPGLEYQPFLVGDIITASFAYNGGMTKTEHVELLEPTTQKMVGTVPTFKVFPWHVLEAVRCCMGLNRAPAVDRNKYPHDCTFCGKPAYIGAVPAAFDCSASCRSK